MLFVRIIFLISSIVVLYRYIYKQPLRDANNSRRSIRKFAAALGDARRPHSPRFASALLPKPTNRTPPVQSRHGPVEGTLRTLY